MKNDRVREFVWLDTRSPEEQSFLANTNSKNKLPDGFEFLPVKRSINIKKEKDNKRQYIELLLEADPSEDMINKYLKDGDLFVLTYKDEVASIGIMLEEKYVRKRENVSRRIIWC